MKKKVIFAKNPPLLLKIKNVTLKKITKKRVRKSIFPFRKKLLKSQDLAKKKIIRDKSFLLNVVMNAYC